MRPTEEIKPEAYRKLVAGRKTPRRSGTPPRPREPATGLSTRLLEGWSVQSPDAIRYRLYLINTTFDTGLQPSLKEACEVAGGMWKAAGMRRKKALKS